MSSTVHHAHLTAARTVATDVIEYRFALDPDDVALRWRAGQFISIGVGEQDDGTPILRSYSLASRPGGGGFRLLVKLVAGGPASEWFRRLAVGERFRFTGPMGFFVLDLQHFGDVVLAATGTGVAPFVPMVEELLERAETGRIHLFFGVRHETDLFWREEIQRLAAASDGRFLPTLAITRPTPTWTGACGRINTMIFDQLPRLHRPVFYLCGNGAMIREVKAGLLERGVDRKRQIRTEPFFD